MESRDSIKPFRNPPSISELLLPSERRLIISEASLSGNTFTFHDTLNSGYDYTGTFTRNGNSITLTFNNIPHQQYAPAKYEGTLIYYIPSKTITLTEQKKCTEKKSKLCCYPGRITQSGRLKVYFIKFTI